VYQPMILKYDLDSFEPFISRKTMDIHYNRLYLKYLGELNKVLKINNFSFGYPVSDLFAKISDFPIQDRANILYNAGGVVNHELYFNSIINKDNEVIPEPLNSALIKQYGSIDKFIDELREKAMLLTGSGYTFLVVNFLKELLLINLSNQDSPYFYNFIPIMAIDVWEHAYFLDNYNEILKYINNFIKFINY